MSDNKNFQSGKKMVNPIAFPTNGGANGMSLRDYFAAKAMQAILANPPKLNGKELVDQDSVAKGAYLIADSMLKARISPSRD